MMSLDIYKEVKSWKRPLHILRDLLAKNYLKLLPNVTIIGITGSVGKTLTQNAIASVLSQKFKVAVGDENLDPTFRIPKTILSAKPWHQKIILEYGVEHPGDMDHYLQVASPKIAVVTNIAPTHLKYLKNEEGVFAEKSKLVKSLKKNDFAVLNADDPYCQKMAQMTRAKIYWFGRRAKDGIKISHFSQNLNGSKFRLHFRGEKASVRWRIVGKHQLIGAYAAATIGLISGLTLKQIAKGLSQAKPPNHRLNVISTKKLSIIDDTYNASPKAVEEAVKTLVVLGKRKTKILILGEMKDLGEKSEQLHEKLGQKIAKFKIDFLITVGKIAEKIAESARKNGFGGKLITVSNAKDATKIAKEIRVKNRIYLVKGSRHAHLERVVNSLLGRSTVISCYHCGVLK